jgi:hypothetical protein
MEEKLVRKEKEANMLRQTILSEESRLSAFTNGPRYLCQGTTREKTQEIIDETNRKLDKIKVEIDTLNGKIRKESEIATSKAAAKEALPKKGRGKNKDNTKKTNFTDNETLINCRSNIVDTSYDYMDQGPVKMLSTSTKWSKKLDESDDSDDDSEFKIAARLLPTLESP